MQAPNIKVLLLVCLCQVCGDMLCKGQTEESINKVLRMADSYNAEKEDTAKKLFEIALEQSLKVKFQQGSATALANIGSIYSRKGDFIKSIEYSKQAIAYARNLKNKKILITVYNNLGSSYFAIGEYLAAAKSLDSGINELHRSEIKPTPKVAINIYGNLGVIYIRLNLPNKALYYLNEGENLARQANYFNGSFCLILNSKGTILQDQKDYLGAYNYYHEAWELSKKNEDVESLILSEISLGDLAVLEKKYAQGISYLTDARKLAAQEEFTDMWVTSSYSLGEALCQQKKFSAATNVLEAGLKKAAEIHFYDDNLDAYKTLAKAYEGDGQFKNALKTERMWLAMKDSVMSVEKTQAINNLEVKYRTAQKDKELAEGSLKLAKQQRDLARKNFWIAGILLTFFSGGLFGWVRYKHYQKLKRTQIKALEQEKEMKVVQSMINGEEKERKRIGRELHDGVGGLLFAIKQNLKQAKQHHVELDEDESFRDAMCMLEEATGELRKTAHNLMPEVLLHAGLAEAINIYADRTAKSHLIGIDVQSYGELPHLEPALELSVYRIIQELIHNAVKHAEASHILVQLNMHEGQFSIMVEDDGKGMDHDSIDLVDGHDKVRSITRKSGMGMQSIRERVMALQGEMEIDSTPGVGTTVRLEFSVRRLEEISL